MNTSFFEKASPMPLNLSHLKLLPIVMLAFILPACGGGGSSASSSVAPATPALSYSVIVTSVPAPAYGLADDSTLSSLMSTIRLGSGAGLLAQASALDVAAKNHADYLVNNNLVANGAYLDAMHDGIRGGHYEDSAKAGYTGASPQARATASGYAGTVTELISFGSLSAADCLSSLENSVYHLAQIISPFVDLGIALNSGNGGGLVCALELGVSAKTLGQLPAAGSVVVYPYAGQTGVETSFYNQSEAPIPAPDLSVAGHPVGLSLYSQAAPTLAGSDVVIQALSLTAAGAAVDARVLASTGVTSTGPVLTIDTNLSGAGFVFLLPNAPLLANTTYQVSFAATVKGAPVSMIWSFATGASN